MSTTNIPIRYGSEVEGFTGEVIMDAFKTKAEFVAWGKDIYYPSMTEDDRVKALEAAYDVICEVMKPAAPETPVESAETHTD